MTKFLIVAMGPPNSGSISVLRFLHSILTTIGVQVILEEPVAAELSGPPAARIPRELIQDVQVTLARKQEPRVSEQSGNVSSRESLLTLLAKVADYLETATSIVEQDADGDEDDVADACNLVAEARALIAAEPTPATALPQDAILDRVRACLAHLTSKGANEPGLRGEGYALAASFLRDALRVP